MPQEVQELINKIKAEGVEEARKKAEDIEAKAQKRAQTILAEAEQKAADILREAESETAKMKNMAQNAIRQSARDTLLSLRREIQGILRSIVLAQVKEALTPEALAAILGHIAEKSLHHKAQETHILVPASDLEKIKKNFTGKLQAKLKEGIEIRPSLDAGKGFAISFDGGKSEFDFSDESLAEYLCGYLNEEIAALMKHNTSE